jgi:death-on-curing protein
MIRYLSVSQILRLHQMVIDAHGGTRGIRDQNALESVVAQPQAGFGAQELYPSLADKASALAFSLVMNHFFVDGNKRVGHAAMVVFLMSNGHDLTGTIDEHEQAMLSVAAGRMSREEFTDWVSEHLAPLAEESQQDH